jgi:hypothetical protein
MNFKSKIQAKNLGAGTACNTDRHDLYINFKFVLLGSKVGLTFGTRVLHLNFSTPCMQNVNNTGGTKKGNIMK